MTFFYGGGEGIATKIFYGTAILQLKVAKGLFFGNLSLEPSMDILSQTLLQVNDSTH